MKKIFALFLALLSIGAYSQTTTEEFKAGYERQVRNVGLSGPGVETILDRWEEAFPDDKDMLLGRYSFYYGKSRTVEVVPKDKQRFMGNKPTFTLKDEKGNPVNYFEENMFDDEYFAKSQQVLDRIIGMYPDELLYQCAKITSMLEYEKESPELAPLELAKLIDVFSKNHPAWTYDGEKVTAEDFADIIQQYCATLYQVGTDVAYEAFKNISTSMNKLFPKNVAFIDNLGSYWLVAQRNYKKAISYYNKALKLDGSDETASKNRKVAEREMEKSKKK